MSLSSRRAWIEIPLFAWPSGPRVGRSPHGERGLKLRHARLTRLRIRRSPHGERGLKCMRSWLHRGRRGSLSSRRAWIEITIPDDSRVVLSGRSPHGERGLKCQYLAVSVQNVESLSSRRAWIEISRLPPLLQTCRWSLSSRRAWIEIQVFGVPKMPNMSLSSRRAWIEILRLWRSTMVVLSLSSRRAWIEIQFFDLAVRGEVEVALLTESVD